MDGTCARSSFRNYSSPWRNLAWSLRKSRDNWKSKHQQLKRQQKRLENQVRDVRRSRSHWRQLAEKNEQQARALEKENAQLKAELAAAAVASEKKG